jgi:predicted RNase H-like nuclease (RuvC/YqgF family)
MVHTEEKELVWLPKEVAARVKQLEDAKKSGDLVLEYVEQSKRDLKTSLESLEDDVIRFKSQMISARKKFEDAKNVELEANYAVWEKFDLEKSSIRKKAGELKDELKPMIDELKQVKQLMDQINTYDIQRLLTIIKDLNHSFYGETGNILTFLFNNYKKNDAAS